MKHTTNYKITYSITLLLYREMELRNNDLSFRLEYINFSIEHIIPIESIREQLVH